MQKYPDLGRNFQYAVSPRKRPLSAGHTMFENANKSLISSKMYDNYHRVIIDVKSVPYLLVRSSLTIFQDGKRVRSGYWTLLNALKPVPSVRVNIA